MAPGTNLGAATPVEIGGPLPGLPATAIATRTAARTGKDQTRTPPPEDAMSAKVTNDAVAFIRSLAELRGRNADWAEKAVREAASLSANAALQAHVIDLVARDTTELLRRSTAGRSRWRAASGALATKGLAGRDARNPAGSSELLSVITDPNIAVILMLIGVYGLVFEFSSPGAVAPGVIGTICLLLGLYALNLLPIDYAGLALMLLGIAFLVVEAFNPTVVLGLGGLVAFLLGAAMLFKVEAPGYQLSWTVIGIAAAMIFGPDAADGQLPLARPQELRRGSARKPCAACRPKSSTGREMRAMSAPKANAGRRRGEGGLRARRDGRGDTTVNGLTLEVRRRQMRSKTMENSMIIDYVAYLRTRAHRGRCFSSSAIRILREYQRGVVFTLGRFTGVKGPGLIILVPFVQQMVKVDLRVVVQDVPPQDVISRDNVSVKVNAVLYFRIVDPERAIIRVEDFMAATSQLAQTTLRSVLGKHELDEMLAERDRLNSRHPGDPRPADRRLGHQGDQCRDQAYRPQREHDPRHRQAGRGRAAAAGKGDQRRR